MIATRHQVKSLRWKRCQIAIMAFDMTKKPPAPSDIADKFMLRMPDGLRERLKVEAAKNGRSMNSEIIARIEMSFGEGDNDLMHATKMMRDQYRIIAELLEMTGLKIPKKLRRDVEELASPPFEDDET